MRRVLVVLLLFGISALYAQVGDSVRVVQQQAMKTQPQKKPANRVYYGGTVGFTFGNYFSLRFMPMVGYKVSPKLSAGMKLGYEYVQDKRYSKTVTTHNYGGSVFGRFRLVPQMYLHAEYAYISYEYSISNQATTRDWVPFLFLGGGLVQSVGKNSFAYVEVLFDVLQSDKSPYKDWDPWISFGVSVGF